MLLLRHLVKHFCVCQHLLSNQLIVDLKLQMKELDQSHFVNIDFTNSFKNFDISNVAPGVKVNSNGTKRIIQSTSFRDGLYVKQM